MPGVNPPVEMKKRLDDLRATDSEYVDSVVVLAKKEDTFRTEYLDQGVPGTDAMKRNRTADAFSDEVLKTMEAERTNGVDALTGLLNRAALDRELPRFFSREIREEGGRGSLLMVDFDHFKRINDEHGHLAGDDALRQMAKILRDMVRPLDRVYRYGGEEFVVYLPKTSVYDAEKVAEHIRKAIEGTPIEVVDANQVKHPLKKTVSIGCVGLDTVEVRKTYQHLFDIASQKKPLPADDVNALIKTLIGYADVAVYVAKVGDSTNPDALKRKEHNRNQVVVYRDGLSKKSL